MRTARKRARGKAPARARAPQEEAETSVLFVRRFPEVLLREARALASLRGVTIREVLVEALGAYLDRAPDWRR